MIHYIETIKRIETAVKTGAKHLDLSKLDLETQDLEQIMPLIIEKLPGLKTLDLAYNAFHVLPESVTGLKGLEELDVSFNKNTFKYVKHIKKLKNLVVSFDQYHALHFEMSELKSLLVYRLKFDRLAFAG